MRSDDITWLTRCGASSKKCERIKDSVRLSWWSVSINVPPSSLSSVLSRPPLQRDMAGLSSVLALLTTITATSAMTVKSLPSRQDLEEDLNLVSPLEVPDGFDLRTGERQEDGQFCVYKKLDLEGWF